MQRLILAFGASVAFMACLPGAAHARFLQVDPIRYEDQNNLYAYVGNDPVNRFDPTGLYECGEGVDCPKFEDYRQTMIVARNTFETGSDDYNRIDGALQNVGEPNDGGMIINEGGVNTKNSSVSATMSDGNMTIYTPTLEANAKASATDANEFGASIVAHEADTGHMQPIGSLSDRVKAEVSGYTTQDSVNRAFGNRIGPSYDAFDRAFGIDRAGRINSHAQGSVYAACAGSSHRSCK